jgi:PHD/YefM family antitoxin component YafN of YafNO toxin-antitoxin module
VNETRRHVIITQNGEPKAVLQDPASFEEMRAALTLMKMISQSEKAIREGKIVDNDKVFRDLEERLKDR